VTLWSLWSPYAIPIAEDIGTWLGEKLAERSNDDSDQSNDNNSNNQGLPDSTVNTDLDDMSKAGSEPDPADKGGKLTRAGRAIDKHGKGARPGSSKFPPAQGSPETRNKIGQEQLDDILTDPDSTTTDLGRGGKQVTAPDGRAARFNPDGTFDGFVEVDGEDSSEAQE
jgi:hypothetical protein